MKAAILGSKSSQSQIFDDSGERIPVSFIKTSPCYLIGTRVSSPGHLVIKLGFGQTKNIKKSTFGEIKKAGIKTPLRFIREFSIKIESGLKKIEEQGKPGLSLGDAKVFVGEEFKASLFLKKGDLICKNT